MSRNFESLESLRRMANSELLEDFIFGSRSKKLITSLQNDPRPTHAGFFEKLS